MAAKGLAGSKRLKGMRDLKEDMYDSDIGFWPGLVLYVRFGTSKDMMRCGEEAEERQNDKEERADKDTT